MNLLEPILADAFTKELCEQAQAAGATSFKVDELALWHADREASGHLQARRPLTIKVGPFTYWLHPEPQPCP